MTPTLRSSIFRGSGECSKARIKCQSPRPAMCQGHGGVMGFDGMDASDKRLGWAMFAMFGQAVVAGTTPEHEAT